jgi:serine/threonine protein phosphatase PrpC
MKVLTAFTNRLGNRTSNQDRCLVLERPDFVLLAVADGMGGHAGGELAAQATVERLQRSLVRQRGPIARPRAFLQDAFEAAHLDVIEAGRSRTPPIKPRTTCVACVVQGNKAYWAHLGDSRLYLLRNGTLVTRTRDHTPVEDLLKSGAISEAELRNHPLRNGVSRCLGGLRPLPDISFGQAELRADDTLLLCSDGLWNALPEQKLVGIPGYGNLQHSVDALSNEAELASYPHSDNISLVALRWLSATSPQKRRHGTRPSCNTAQADDKDPLQQAIDDIHRAMLDYAAEMKKS